MESLQKYASKVDITLALSHVKSIRESYEYLQELYKQVDNNTGEISDDLLQEMEYHERVLDYAVSEVKTALEENNSAIDELKGIKNAIDNVKKAIETNNEIIKTALAETNINVSTANYTVSQRQSTSIEVADDFDIKSFSVQYPQLTRTKLEVDKPKLKKFFENTDMLPSGIVKKVNNYTTITMRNSE